METVLKGVADYLISKDTEKKFKRIEYSEFIDDLISQNQMPFLDIIGLKETKTPISNMLMEDAYSQVFDITLVICQDSKVTKDIIQGNTRKSTLSIWSLADYVYDLISQDPTFNGVVNRLAEKEITSELTTLTKDSSVKLALEMKITLIKDVFN